MKEKEIERLTLLKAEEEKIYNSPAIWHNRRDGGTGRCRAWKLYRNPGIRNRL